MAICIIILNNSDLTGEMEDRYFVTTRGDSRLSMTIARNKKTAVLGRTNRFLIDDPDSTIKLAYTLTKPFKLGGTYNHEGVFKFVLQEVNTTYDDNQEVGIADYFKHFPRPVGQSDDTPSPDNGGRYL